ncbi:hypothetical protein BH11ACT4_BH11ACT4_14120 [soil metagenome]
MLQAQELGDRSDPTEPADVGFELQHDPILPAKPFGVHRKAAQVESGPVAVPVECGWLARAPSVALRLLYLGALFPLSALSSLRALYALRTLRLGAWASALRSP